MGSIHSPQNTRFSRYSARILLSITVKAGTGSASTISLSLPPNTRPLAANNVNISDITQAISAIKGSTISTMPTSASMEASKKLYTPERYSAKKAISSSAPRPPAAFFLLLPAPLRNENARSIARKFSFKSTHSLRICTALLRQLQEHLFQTLISNNGRRGAHFHQSAAFYNGNAVAQLFRYLQYVRGEKHRAACRADLAQKALEHERGLRVQPDKGFIQNQQPRARG